MPNFGYGHPKNQNYLPLLVLQNLFIDLWKVFQTKIFFSYLIVDLDLNAFFFNNIKFHRCKKMHELYLRSEAIVLSDVL